MTGLSRDVHAPRHRNRTSRPLTALLGAAAAVCATLAVHPAATAVHPAAPAAESAATAAPVAGVAAAPPTGWVTVVNSGSGKCLDARAAATVNGTAVQQYACNGTTAQQWTITPTADGHVQIGNRNDTAQVVDVSDVSAADNAAVHLWTYGGGNNQQWQAVDEGGERTASSTGTAASAWTCRPRRPRTASSWCSTPATVRPPSASRWPP